uniref:Uncharacterized protein n=1 Tax=Ditylenchus dipsaci TaxID=166011 RepID=A0A915E8S0_9BILA
MALGLLGGVLSDIALSGVNFSLAGNGGPECIDYIPPWQRWLETLIFSSVSFYGIYCSIGNLEFGSTTPPAQIVIDKKALTNGNSENGKDLAADTREIKCHSNITQTKQVAQTYIQTLLSNVVDTVPALGFVQQIPTRELIFRFYVTVFVIELCYKTLTRTLIFFLNPCHLSTVLQLILLKIPQENHGPWAVQLFRFHLYTVPGALMALAFPILNTRLMIGEMFIYFVQHILIVSVPFYLMSIKDTYSPESLTNYSWPMFSASLLVLYHFLFLQTVSLLTQVNLNCIMCPAVSDPLEADSTESWLWAIKVYWLFLYSPSFTVLLTCI